jgi:hypothetical protein
LLLPRSQAALADLAAAAYFHAIAGPGGGGTTSRAAGPDGDGDDLDAFEASPLPPAKRRRAAPLLCTLGERLSERPPLWAPVLGRLLLEHALALPPAAMCEWLRQLAAMAPAHLPSHFMSDEHDADVALWLLRLAHALSLAWPVHLTSGGCSNARGVSGSETAASMEELPSAAELEEHWMVSIEDR